jgi:hypothetical protein
MWRVKEMIRKNEGNKVSQKAKKDPLHINQDFT